MQYGILHGPVQGCKNISTNNGCNHQIAQRMCKGEFLALQDLPLHRRYIRKPMTAVI